MNIRKIGLLGVVLLSGGVVPAYAVDTWSTTKGVLNIPLVTYGGKTYQNVTAVLGGVISVGSQCSNTTSTSADSLSSTTGQLSIPAVTVTTTTGSITYCNASVWLSSITSVGGVCADATSCAQYFTPVSYASTMPRSYTPSQTLVTGALTNRARYLISNSSSVSTSAKYLAIGNDYNTAVASGYAATSATIPLSSTYKTYLNKLIQVLQVADNGTNATVYNITTSGYSNVGYRLDSHLHPNESIDADSSGNLKFVRNIGGPSSSTATLPEVTSTGFVAFAYDSVAHTLRAVKRYTRSVVQDTTTACTKSPCYNASFAIDTSFALTNYYVNFNAATGTYSLVSAVGSATPFYFYSSSDGYGVPSIMNPTNTAYTTTNPPAAFPSNATTSATETNFANTLNVKYRPQVSSGGVTKPGANADTKAAADAFLVTMKSQVEGNSSTLCNGEVPSGTATGDLPQAALRYSPAVYTAFRDALLSGALVSDAVADGTPNQRLVPFVWFTNEADSNGCYHPFMNIVTYSQSSNPHGLLDIPVPPAAGSNTAGVPMTRLTNLVSQTTRIPMRNYGNVNTTNLTSINNGTNVPNFDANLYCDKQYPVGATRDACAAAANASGDPFNWASSNDNGISYDGAQTFPIMNASVIPSSWKAELSTYGCHVGQGGGGAHCHADGYAPTSNNKLSLYNDSDYVGKTHPPLVAFGYDGIATFGRYRSQDSSMLGASVALDAFAGHDHDGIGYHYHARESQMPASPYIYTYTANGKTICSSNDPSCVAGQNYSGGVATPTPVSTLVQGAWKANLKNTPCFRGGAGSATAGNPIWNSTACNAFLGK